MPPLILLHGWTMRGAIFDDLVARLAGIAECHAPDLPGHGRAADAEPSLAACAEAVAGAVAACPAPPVVLGWSMGAAAAWRYIGRHGTARLAGLITVDMSPRVVSGPGWPHGLRGQSAADVAATTARFARDWEGASHSIAATMFATADGAPGLSVAGARAQVLSNDPGKMRALWADLAAMDLRAVIPRIDVPYLVCSGALSRVYPASASDWIAATAPRARRQVFAASGHSPHLEEPEAFARAVAEFLAEI